MYLHVSIKSGIFWELGFDVLMFQSDGGEGSRNPQGQRAARRRPTSVQNSAIQVI